ncbi:hypothetical protein LS482_14025 [Sinomicrobium kalidii]|uniref:hypothetical protein n=1 Tax=Sinomicrobium kalidii TaxID=2900738 RepID=UPI001E534FA6|nr:hypothetical protein [Sinomicrobium kalidii]UGU14810.1 hypothetical protein LS482_14025 [Sinomicrobium kalidii]
MNTQNDKWSALTRKNTKHLAYWTAAWVLTMAVVAFGPKFVWNFNATVSVLFIVINTVIGAGMILANKRYLNGLDEMQRKLSLEAMAIALGVGVVGGLTYSMLDMTDILSYDAEISHLVILISVTYLIGIIIGNIRYK